MPEKKTVPSLRFAGFDDAWEQHKLGELVQISSGEAPSKFCEGQCPYVKVDDLNYTLRVVMQTQHQVQEHPTIQMVKRHSIVFPKRGAAILTNKVRILGVDSYMDTNMMALIPQSIDFEFLYVLLSREGLYRIADTSTIPQINNKHIEPYSVFIPRIEEQPIIGTFFVQLDRLITLHQRKYEMLVKTKKAMLQKMFPRDGAKVPEIRFAGFTGAWEQCKVGDVTTELTEYATLSSGLPLLTSSRAGIMYQTDYRGNATTDNQGTLFSVVPIGACTYRHMSDDDIFHLNYNILCKGLVSREYPVFIASGGNNLSFIIQYLNSSPAFAAFCKEQKKGGTRTRLYYNTLCNHRMMIAPADEQKKIADYFSGFDNLITLHQRKYEILKHLKQSLLEKMFV